MLSIPGRRGTWWWWTGTTRAEKKQDYSKWNIENTQNWYYMHAVKKVNISNNRFCD